MRIKIPRHIADDLLFRTGMRCCICRESQEIQIHHIDGNPNNNNPDNLITLCALHHGVASGRSGFGRNWTPSLLKRFRQSLIDDITRHREKALKMQSTLASLANHSATTTYQFNLGAVYEEHFEEFYKYSKSLESSLRAITYREMKGLWTTRKGLLYLGGNVKLLAANKIVRRIFVIDYSSHLPTLIPTIREALKHEYLGVQVRILFRKQYIENIPYPEWDMFGIHDDKYLTFYKVENESVLAGVVSFKDKAKEAIEVYDEIFYGGLKVKELCKDYKIFLTPQEYKSVTAEAQAILQAISK